MISYRKILIYKGNRSFFSDSVPLEVNMQNKVLYPIYVNCVLKTTTHNSIYQIFNFLC